MSRPPLSEKLCPFCKELYTPRAPNQKKCRKPACREAYRRQRNRARYANRYESRVTVRRMSREAAGETAESRPARVVRECLRCDRPFTTDDPRNEHLCEPCRERNFASVPMCEGFAL